MRAPWEITREMFLSFEEVSRLLAHVRTRARDGSERGAASAQLDRLIIECLLFSGLRNSEFCRLRVADTIVGQRQSVFVVGSSKDRGRTVFIPQPVSNLVRQYVQSARPTLLSAKATAKAMQKPLVLNERGNPYERTGLYRRVVRILSDAGLENRASVQLLRHTYGYLAYARCGGNLLFVQRQLGHAHPMVTSIYAQFVDESYEAIAERLWGHAEHAPRRRRRRNHSSRGGKR